MRSVITGALGEKSAREFLERHGLQLVRKNFRASEVNPKAKGEIDLIMWHEKFLVFIEVKLRSITAFGDAIEMISDSKQSRLIQTATYFLQSRGLYHNTYCRFDVIGLQPNPSHTSELKITWIQDAFQVNY